jgi:predicted RNA-binding protein with EMAP domain
LSSIDAAFRDSSATVVDRLLKISECLNSMLREQREFIKGNSIIYTQLKAFMYAYMEAVEISHTPTLIDAAVALVNTYKAIFSAPDEINPTKAIPSQPVLA